MSEVEQETRTGERARVADYRELIKQVEQAVQEIERADDVGSSALALAESILARFREQLGLTGGRVYRRDEDDFELIATFGDARPVRRPFRVPADYEPIQRLERRGVVYMGEDDSAVDRRIEQELGTQGFAAIQVDEDTILAFDVAEAVDPEEVRYSLGILRHSITERLRQERLYGILHEARRIQASITPRRSPDFAGYDLFGRTEPMEIVGGDYFDYIPVTGKILGLAIADVSGHGLPAALQVRDIYMGLRMGLSRDYKIVRTVERLNAIIHESTLTNRFVSMFYGELEADGLLIYVNAGHPSPLHFRNDGQEVELEEGGPVLGPLRDASYERGFVRLRPGEMVALYTDGIDEARRPLPGGGWEEYGVERLRNALRRNRDRSAEEIVDAVRADIIDFRGTRPPRDDRTLVVVKRLPDA